MGDIHLSFFRSDLFSLGVELELQLINLKNYDLSNEADELIKNLPSSNQPWKIKPEATQSLIEITSSIHKDHISLKNELIEAKNELIKYGENLNIGFCGGGTHPFQLWSDREISSNPRYQQLKKNHGFLVKLATSFAQQIHVSCQSGDQAIFLCHALSKYIPHFIALSASSPYYQSVDTNFDSSRVLLRDFLPNSGKIPSFKNWAEFEKYFLRCREMGIIKTMKDVYWDVRPKPEFGTIEIRVADTPLYIEKVIQLAAYAQALVAFLCEEKIGKLTEDLYIAYQYNRFQAARFGLNAKCINHFENKQYFLKEDILATIKLIEPYSKDLGSHQLLLDLANDVNAKINDAQRLRSIVKDEFGDKQETIITRRALENLVKKQMEYWNNNST